MEDTFRISIKSTEDSSGVTIKLTELGGKLDRISSSNFTKKIMPLIEQGDTFFIMDLGALDYIDSAGIYSILQCYVHSREKKGYLKLIRLSGNVSDTFNSLGLTKIIPTYATLEEALKG